MAFAYGFRHKNWGWISVIAIYAGTFILDVNTPLGFIDWIFYFPPILLDFPIPSKMLFLVTSVATLLTAIGLFLSPPGVFFPFALFNRSSGMAMLWLATLSLQKRRRESQRLKESSGLLKESREIFNAFFYGAPVTMDLFDSNHRYIQLNTAAERYLGKSAQDVIGKSITEIAPGFAATVIPAIDTVLRTRKPLPPLGIRGASSTRPGKTDYFFINYFPVSLANGELGVGVIAADITQTKEFEEKLKESEERFRIAQELSPDGFLIFRPLRDASGSVTDFIWVYENTAAARMNDTIPGEVCGKRLLEALPHHGQSSFHKAYKEVAETGEVRVVEESSYAQDSFRKRRWFRVVAVPTAGGDVAVLVQDISSRKETEDALRESEARLKLSTQAAKIGVFQLNIQTGVNVWSPELEAMYGLAPGEFDKTQDAWEKLVYPADRAAAIALVNQAFKTSEPVQGEWRTERRDGTIHWILGRFQVIRDSAGKPLYLTGAHIDITDIRRLKDRILRAEEHLRLALDAGNEGTFDFDLIKNQVTLGVKSRHIFGLNPDEPFTYDTFLDLVHPDDRKKTDEAVKRAIAGESDGRYKVEFRIITRAGGIRWLAVNGQVYFEHKGKNRVAVRFIGTNTDISERKNIEEKARRAEESLRHKEEDLRRAQEVGQIGSWRLDVNKNELTWSKEIYRIFGVPEGTPLTYETFISRIYPDDRAYVDAKWKAGMRGEPYDIDHRILFDGGIKWVREKAFLEFDQKGKLLGGFGITQDITERKNAEEVLLRDKETLDRLVTERSHRLLETQKELDRSRRLSDLGKFAATVAHELRNPLVAIQLAGANIKRKVANPVVGRNVDNIEKKVGESNEIIDNLLVYARLRPPEVTEINIFNLVAETVETAKRRYEKRNVEIHIKDDEVIGTTIPADPLQMKELFSNLINNAIEAVPQTDKGEIRILIQRINGKVETEIRDNGVGISPENLDKIFEPFFSTKTQGTGLGLSVVKQIIEMHNGDIRIDSEVGKGTAITVILPVGSGH